MELDEISLKEARKILVWALNNKYSDFYRKKYKGKVDLKKIKTVEDFKKVPFLKRDDLSKVSPFERIFTPFKNIKATRLTSGTLGSGPLITFFSDKTVTFDGKRMTLTELNTNRVLRKMGIRYFLFLRQAFTLNNERMRQDDPFAIAGDVNNLAATADLVAKLKIEAIITTPTILYFFTPYLKEKYPLTKIKYLSLLGEFSSLEKQRLIRKTFPNATLSASYTASEGSHFAFQCEALAKKNIQMHHVLPNAIVECVDPLTGKTVPHGQMGELIRTVWEPDNFPSIRHKTGDWAIIRDEKCECGRKEYIFEVLGRVGVDSVNIQGATILTSDVLKTLNKIRGLEMDFKAHVYEKITRGRVRYQIELWCISKNKKNIKNSIYIKKIRDKIENDLRVSSSLSYGDLVKKDVLLPLKLVLKEEFLFEDKRRHFITHF